MIDRLLYRILYAWTLYKGVPDMSLLEAWRWPRPDVTNQGDPIEDAESEMDCMCDG